MIMSSGSSAQPPPEPFTLVIVDDEAPARARLRDLLADIHAELPHRIVGEADSGLHALEVITSQPVDVALVDIRMPVMDGLELAQHLSRCQPAPAVIFVTAYDAYAVQAFELNAIDYLLKPVRATRLQAALQKAMLRRSPPSGEQLALLRQAARTHLSCHERGRVLLIAVSEIIYLKADRKYVTARTREREFLIDDSLAQLEEEFADRFIRLHRSVLVAKDAIIGFERSHLDDNEAQWQAILHNIPDRLPVSRRQWSLVRGYARRSGS
ncbi:MAG TPA: LytTR family DNA-binding domain-containing protein [Accumulibacter sp.]|nr:LytTR family DNA-binding domain-containing protein [Accumulibacter sp.]HNC17669.1 LytTR family DNA-binding domain-containing protein [Accumulibacter sp.]HNG39456.1 LytTR family DNA-binding domain-containing protein [Accumulibacter sp.]HNI73660.1 LytTR family DNA-binding domain-containing protein [Accumulibacter sp.]HNK00712.1 LytTR family DNA-binding domain-containing protein [Accumulibacter sp.]